MGTDSTDMKHGHITEKIIGAAFTLQLVNYLKATAITHDSYKSAGRRIRFSFTVDQY